MARVIFLYETSGLAALPFVAQGFEVHCFDKENTTEVKDGIHYHKWDAVQDSICWEQFTDVVLVFGMPPCTDLAVSGAKHFGNKRADDPAFQRKALNLVRKVPEIALRCNAPYAIENPVSVISTFWRKPNFIFHPYQYGGYLPENDAHPLFPEYINARDAYSKKTCLWTSTEFKLPKPRPVSFKRGWSKQTTKLGGKSARTKYIRSLSPRGFFTALALEVKSWRE